MKTEMRHVRRFNEAAGLGPIGLEEAIEWVRRNYDSGRVAGMFDEELRKWVDREAMESEGYDSEYDWYIDYGRGDAEAAVVDAIVAALRAERPLGFDEQEICEHIRAEHPCLDWKM